MKTTVLAGIAISLSTFGDLAYAADPRTGVPAVPAGWTFALPEGNAVSGKKAWEHLDCDSCHAIAGTAEARGGRGAVGPELSGYGVLPREYIAESIIKAHTVVAAPGYVVEKDKATMGNYNHFLTVQELLDLVAFLRTIGPASTME